VIIPTAIPPLLAEIESVLVHPEGYGLPVLANGGLALMDVLEALLPSPKWEWLTVDDLVSTVRRSERFQLVNDEVVILRPAGGSSSADSLSAATAATMADKTPVELFLALPVNNGAAVGSLGTPARLYVGQETAMLVAGARAGTFELVRLYHIHTRHAELGGTQLRSLGRGVFLGTGLTQSMLEQVRVDLAAPWMDALRYRLKLAETLFLDDPGPQSDAARALFELRPQSVVEADLVPHLAGGDRFVRINVLTALGLPAYKVGFVPGTPFPPRQERLEPATLAPETVQAILAMAHEERDVGVLSYVLCTLKAQTYMGRLREVSPQIREVIRRDVLPRVEEPSVVDDAKELLGLLPPLEEG
jgi:hypothetical protein